MTLHAGDDPALWRVAVDSVLAQRVAAARVEIHLGVDGPLGRAQERLVEEYRPRLARVRRNARSLGLAATLNGLIEGLGAADFVFRMDGDDISLPGRFAAQVAALEARPDLDLVGCQAWDIARDGTRIAPRDFPTEPASARWLLARQNPVLHPTWCLRGRLLADAAIRYPDAHLTEDLAFLVRLASRRYRFASIPERLFEWRIGPDFYQRRRSLRRGLAELVWYGRAVRLLHGPASWRYAYPVARLALRCAPPAIARAIYGSPLRATS